MPIYIEAILWYLLAIDSLVYLYFAFSKKKIEHWLSKYIPINCILAIIYVLFTFWLGFSLLRLQIILFK